jgi:hypothetical protein
MANRIVLPLLVVTLLAMIWAIPGAVFAQDAATPAASCVKTESGDRCLPIAPDSERVDLAEPVFSNPTNVTNPLFPVSDQHSVLILGNIEGAPLRIEVTLLPKTETIKWSGHQTETLLSQFVATLDGRIEEVAIDRYAQADDGSVWYFGEDVFNYKDGVVADTEGTWLAGKDGPPAMIMPAHPQVGDVYHSENMPNFVFEEVTVNTVGETVNGPTGPVEGAMIGRELHQDGMYEDKIFAPGYGEFRSGSPGEVEALALAVPTDALTGSVPAELETIAESAAGFIDANQSVDWDAAEATVKEMNATWSTYRANDVPDLIEYTMSDAVNSLSGAIDARDTAATSQAAIDVERSALDLELRYLPPTAIDLARLDLVTRQLLLDVSSDDAAGVRSDVTIQELTWNRIAPTVDQSTAKQIDAQLKDLRTVADAGDLAKAADGATKLRELLGSIS